MFAARHLARIYAQAPDAFGLCQRNDGRPDAAAAAAPGQPPAPLRKGSPTPQVQAATPRGSASALRSQAGHATAQEPAQASPASARPRDRGRRALPLARTAPSSRSEVSAGQRFRCVIARVTVCVPSPDLSSPEAGPTQGESPWQRRPEELTNGALQGLADQGHQGPPLTNKRASRIPPNRGCSGSCFSRCDGWLFLWIRNLGFESLLRSPRRAPAPALLESAVRGTRGDMAAVEAAANNPWAGQAWPRWPSSWWSWWCSGSGCGRRSLPRERVSPTCLGQSSRLAASSAIEGDQREHMLYLSATLGEYPWHDSSTRGRRCRLRARSRSNAPLRTCQRLKSPRESC